MRLVCPAGYPTVCKGRFEVGKSIVHALKEPTSLNTLDLLPRLAKAGVCALKIEGHLLARLCVLADSWSPLTAEAVITRPGSCRPRQSSP